MDSAISVFLISGRSPIRLEVSNFHLMVGISTHEYSFQSVLDHLEEQNISITDSSMINEPVANRVDK